MFIKEEDKKEFWRKNDQKWLHIFGGLWGSKVPRRQNSRSEGFNAAQMN